MAINIIDDKSITTKVNKEDVEIIRLLIHVSTENYSEYYVAYSYDNDPDCWTVYSPYDSTTPLAMFENGEDEMNEWLESLPSKHVSIGSGECKCLELEKLHPDHPECDSCLEVSIDKANSKLNLEAKQKSIKV